MDITASVCPIHSCHNHRTILNTLLANIDDRLDNTVTAQSEHTSHARHGKQIKTDAFFYVVEGHRRCGTMEWCQSIQCDNHLNRKIRIS